MDIGGASPVQDLQVGLLWQEIPIRLRSGKAFHFDRNDGCLEGAASMPTAPRGCANGERLVRRSGCDAPIGSGVTRLITHVVRAY